MSPLLKEMGDLVRWDSEKAKVLNAFFATDFTSKTGLQESQVPEAGFNSWNKDDVSFVGGDWVKEYVNKLDICKSMDHDGMHP